MTRVENFNSPRGGKVPNQFRIWTREGVYFQSYESVIVYAPYMGGPKVLDEKYWDFSTTTGKYRNMFLGEDKAATEKKIKSGEYILGNLN